MPTPQFPTGPSWSDQKAWILGEIERLRDELEIVAPAGVQTLQGQVAAFRAILLSAEPKARPGRGSGSYG